jgi:hypothetical protein
MRFVTALNNLTEVNSTGWFFAESTTTALTVVPAATGGDPAVCWAQRLMKMNVKINVRQNRKVIVADSVNMNI